MRTLITICALFISITCFSQELRRLDGYVNGVHLARFSPDGTKLLIGSGVETNQAHLLDVASGERTIALEGFDNSVAEGGWSAKGDWFYTSSGTAPSIKIWSAEGDLLKEPIYGGCDFASHMAIRPDEKAFAVSCDDTAIIFDEDFNETDSIQASQLYATSIYSSDGKKLIIGSADPLLEVIDMETKATQIIELPLGPKNLEYLPNGELMLTEFYFFKSDKAHIRFYKDLEELSNFTVEEKILFAEFIPGKEQVLLALNGGRVKIVKKDGTLVKDFGRIGSVALSADVSKDGKTAAIGFLGSLVLMDLSAL